MPADTHLQFATVHSELDVLCGRVGLTRAEASPVLDGMSAPPGAALWISSYAHLLLWPALAEGSERLSNSADAGEAWFDEWLLANERRARGRTIDGYLVIALLGAPGEDEREQIRRLELSAHVCRKHLIWPEVAPGEPANVYWRRLADITMLGLPEPSAPPQAELEWPDLDTQAEAVWQDLVSLGAAATLQQDEA